MYAGASRISRCSASQVYRSKSSFCFINVHAVMMEANSGASHSIDLPKRPCANPVVIVKADLEELIGGVVAKLPRNLCTLGDRGICI